MTVSAELVDRLLGLVEQRELGSLQWGYVDGSLSEDEVHTLARVVVSNRDGLAEELVESLMAQGLLFETLQPDGTFRLRSRFGEGVRLLTRLKQVFLNRPWPTAEGLVSDYRIDARARRFPRRNVPLDTVIKSLGLDSQHNELRRLLIEAMLESNGSDILLSAFQLRAAGRLLQDDGASRGLIISAGTGSGKTLAFYLPAFAEIGTWISGDPLPRWVKAVAIYPRRELLKDQFTEVFRLARRVDSLLVARGGRPISLGSFFSLTPEAASVEFVTQAGWPEVRGLGFVCPFLLCPECDGEMVWRHSDIEARKEQLFCRNSGRCAGVASAEQLTLTRRQAVAQPPDVLFTTAQTLNQRLSDTERRAVFGVHPSRDRRARFVLLDEVHTYSGTSGAHVALVLRRWRHAVGSPLRFVGLSATLRDATQFFAQLTGLPTRDVVDVSPSEDEMERRGMEYQLILRGDPVSQTSLLSTSIQVSFLLTRLLDPPRPPRSVSGPSSHGSAGLYGNRAFVFTDDLDAVNRLFDNLRDAEGYNMFGRPDGRLPLANLRAALKPDRARRDVAGQDWAICEALGWQLDRSLQISRTTSQDAGVTPSDVVVATAALEVGFNDPTVGAVLQHKSPRQMAAYVQRKGRAGRTLVMRPWMVTVLSDYGRDRLTFQAYDQLFDPTLPPQHLPVHNQYVLRMQAVFAFIDWLATENPKAHQRGWWWRALNGPPRNQWERDQQAGVQRVLSGLLKGDGHWVNRLADHLRGALQVPEAVVQSLLWEAPRSLMLEVVPTLARRIFSEWQMHPAIPGGMTQDLKASGTRVHPLPDFVPANLFSDLSLPEVTVIIPPATVRHQERQETLSIGQALGQLAPGRVTRRFAFERGALNHWVRVPLDSSTFDMSVTQFAEQHEFVADVDARVGDQVQRVPCFRPWTIRLDKVSDGVVNPTSNAFLDWSSELLPPTEGLGFAIGHGRASGWGEIVERVEFFLHGFRSPLTIRRFALTATANIRRPRTDADLTVQTRFTTDDGEQAAVGYELEVDGLLLRVQIPDPEILVTRAATAPEVNAWRVAYFRDRVHGDPTMRAEANTFQCDWLQQIYFSALVAHAGRANVGLPQAWAELHSGDPLPAFEDVMDALFLIGNGVEDDVAALAEVEEDEHANRQHAGRRRPAKLKERLGELLRRPSIQLRLQELGRELWEPDLSEWGQWLVIRAHETLGEATLMACLYVTPSHAAVETLLLDLKRGQTAAQVLADGSAEIWITESTLGGAGVVDAIAHSFAGDNRMFFKAIEAALAPSDLEITSQNLDKFMQLALEDAEVASAIDIVRSHRDHLRREEARGTLYRLLARKNLGVDHALSVALNHRLLRPGADPGGDHLIGRLLAHWAVLQTRLGVAIDLRAYCYIAARDDAFARDLSDWVRVITGVRPSTADIVAVLSGILWPRPEEIRGRSLDSYSPFRDQGRTDPSLVRRLLLADSVPQVALGSADWLERLKAALAESGLARLVASRKEEQALHAELVLLLATPVSVDYLQFFPTVEQVQRDEGATTVTLVLRELV